MGQRPTAQDEKDCRQWPRTAPSPPPSAKPAPPSPSRPPPSSAHTRASPRTSPRPSAFWFPEYEAIRAQHSIAVKRMAEAFEGSLNDKGTAMHFQRIVGALVSSAVGAGRFYSEKVTQARDATARAADGGDDEHGAPIGLESRAQRTREFAADMAMQAFALLAAAHGAINAYKDLTGEDWKAYEASADATVEKKAAASQMGAFGG